MPLLVMTETDLRLFLFNHTIKSLKISEFSNLRLKLNVSFLLKNKINANYNYKLPQILHEFTKEFFTFYTVHIDNAIKIQY